MKSWWLCLVLLMLAADCARGTQKPLRVYRVALVAVGALDSLPPQVRGLRDALKETGYVEGKNFTLSVLSGEDYDQIRSSLGVLVRQQIDAIVTTSSMGTALASEITKKTPIIFMPAAEPVRSGFVKSQANPGTNLTGLTFFGEFGDNAKQLEVFKQIVPSLKRAVTLYDGRKEGALPFIRLQDLRDAAAHLSVHLIESPVMTASEALEAIRRTTRGTADGVFVICGNMFRTLKGIASIALERRLPVFGCSASQVADEGALLTYSPDLYYMGYRGAWYLDRVLKGAKPQELPVETPTKLDLIINLKTARAIGVTIPPETLLLADKVFN